MAAASTILLFICICLSYCYNISVAFPLLVTVDKEGPAKDDNVQFTCDFVLNADTEILAKIRWTFGDNSTGALITEWTYNAPNDVTYGPGYSSPTYEMGINDIESGQTTLTIDPVQLGNQGRYWCFVGIFGGVNQTYADIEVTVAPSATKLSSGAQEYNDNEIVPVIRGADKIFTCSTDGVNPAATLSWTLSGTIKQPDGPQTDMENGGVFDSSSTLTLTPVLDDHNQLFGCEAASNPPADPISVSTYVQLLVQVPPSTNGISISDTTGSLINGSYAIVNVGTAHTLTCNVVDTRPAAQITWEVDNARPGGDFVIGTPSTVTPSDGLVDTTGTLILTKAERKHHRLKTACFSEITVEQKPPAVTVFVLVDVYGPPDIPEISGNTGEMTEGSEETLACRASDAYPNDYNIRWYNNEVDITQGPASNNGNINDRFDISSTIDFTPDRGDNGNIIKCNVTHDSLDVDLYASVKINVKYSPENVMISQNPTGPIIEGNDVSLTCSASGNPMPTEFEWLKGVSEDVIGTSNPISLNGISREDSGPYKCKASNNIGTGGVSVPATITIYYPPENVVVDKSIDGPVTEGGNVILTCSSDARPPSNMFSWFFDDLLLPGKESNTLELTDITREQAGYYQCRADNAIGTPDTSEKVDVIVHYNPVVTNADDNEVSVDEGKNASLVCSSIGNPEQTTTWYNENGDIIISRNRTEISEVILGRGEVNGTSIESTLRITEVIAFEDHGNYVCNVSNVVGFSVHEITLSGLAIPAPPESVIILLDHTTTESVTVQWKSGHGGGIKQWFYIQYREKDDGNLILSDNITEIEGQKDYIHEINRLTPETVYSIYVASGNLIGDNIGKGDPVLGVTKPSKPAGLDIIFGEGIVSVTGIPQDDDQTTCLQLQTRTNDDPKWTNFEKCLNEDIYDLELLEAVTHVQGVYCFQGVCGEPISSQAKKKQIDKGLNVGSIIGGVIGITVALAVIVILVFYLRWKLYGSSSPLEQPLKTEDINRKHNHGGRNNVEMTVVAKEDTSGNDNPVISTLDSSNYANITSVKFNFPRKNLQVLRELGEGEFGRVLMAKAKGLFGEGETTVAIKTLKDSAGVDAKNQIRKEFEVMKLLTGQKKRNPNIVQLLGACLETDPMYVILEYMPKGDLKTLLRKSRVSKREIICNNDSAYGNLAVGCTSFSPPQLLTFARDVANGMVFLAEQKCIHRDLAARNVLLNEHLVCKVSDFGLARDVKDVEIYQRLNECRLPVRWMAYESVIGDVHTIESDVWSFGVLLWEIITLGGRPYPRMNGVEIRQLLKAGNRMPQPKHCSQQLYTIMSMCWEKEPKNRPTFVQLIPFFDDIIIGQMGYLSMEDLETTLYEDSTAPDANEKV